MLIERARPGGCLRFFVVLTLLVVCRQAALGQVTDVSAALYRTWQPPNRTVVDGLFEFDPRLGGESCEFDIAVQVSDSAETPILNEQWRGVIDCELAGVGGVRVVETFQFAVMPGVYSLSLSVSPAGRPELLRRLDLDLVSLPSDERASDLILGREVAWGESSQDDDHFTFRRGELGLSAHPVVVADSSQPSLSYYVEVYSSPERSMAGVATGVIRHSDGREIAQVRVEELRPSSEDRIVAGTMSLAGLPPGDYGLELQLELGDTLVTRYQPFQMADTAPLVERLMRPVESRTAERGAEDAFLWQLSDKELSELFDPIVLWLNSARQREMYEGLSPDGRRRFLARFFEGQKWDAEGGESALDVFVRRARHVDEAYGEAAGEGEQAGWRTDRGRIYVLRGKPDDRLERAFPTDETPPFEIWYYKVGRGYIYLFSDETRFGHFRLVFSTDPDYPPIPDWVRRAGPGALEELERYFGIRPNLPPS